MSVFKKKKSYGVYDHINAVINSIVSLQNRRKDLINRTKVVETKLSKLGEALKAVVNKTEIKD